MLEDGSGSDDPGRQLTDDATGGEQTLLDTAEPEAGVPPTKADRD